MGNGRLVARSASTDLRAVLQSDLAKSGLVEDDIQAYLASDVECAAVSLRPHMVLAEDGGQKQMSPGYVIPYFNMLGKRIPFYRVRLFHPLPGGPKYLQPPGTLPHVYFPRTFGGILAQVSKGEACGSIINGFDPFIILTEGEKKSARVGKAGMLCAGLGGTYSWKARTLILPADSQLTKDERTGRIRVKLPASLDQDADETEAVTGAPLAEGMQSIISLCIETGMCIVICYDSDFPQNPDVQTAAAQLGFELRTRGIPITRIRQVKLPTNGADKVGVDDYLQDKGEDNFRDLVHETLKARCAFPAHPNIRAFLNGRLGGKLTRNQAKSLALSILADLDTRGVRLMESGTDVPHYFSERDKTLVRVNLQHHNGEPLHETRFGAYLYRTYDMSQADQKILPWLAAAFTGEHPIQEVQPRSVMAVLGDDKIAYQLSDGQIALVTKEGIRIADNGSEGIMFRSDQVEPIDSGELMKAVKELSLQPLTNWWKQVLGTFKFVRPTDLTIASYLNYMSPWLLRWKGTQLPVELVIGEAGSGKSSMMSLRTAVLTGRPALRNQPTDLRDWYAAVASTNSVFVLDNVHFVSKEIRQRLSDEICRLVTEPDPTVELRKLYTTAEVARIPVRCTFALTAIQQPFMQSDILQRSFVFDLAAVGEDHDSDWVGHALNKFGGRVKWVAHHLLILSKFLGLAHEEWDPHHKSVHRLANLEQVLKLMVRTLGEEVSLDMAQTLARQSVEQVSEYDWTMEGLKEYADEMGPICARDQTKVFGTHDIVEWAICREDYQENTILSNARKLGRYLTSHKSMVERATGIFLVPDKANNRQSYRVIRGK